MIGDRAYTQNENDSRQKMSPKYEQYNNIWLNEPKYIDTSTMSYIVII